MINEFRPYNSSLDPNIAKTDQSRKLIIPDRYCNNGIPATGPLPVSSADRANVAVSAPAWSYNPYLGNFYNYYTNQPYELDEGSQQYAGHQKYGPQYPRNYAHQPISSTSVLQCCDPRCQFLCENNKYQFSQPYCNKALPALPPKRVKNYHNSMPLDTPKPEISKFEHFPVKYQSGISYSTNANDLNNKYNNQQSICSSYYQNPVKLSKSLAIPEAAPSPSEFYTDIGKPAYWNKALWNRNVQHNYYPPVDIGKNIHQKLSTPVYEQTGCIPGNQAGGGILFNRLLESGNRSYENNTFVPNYPANNTNQPKSDCKTGYVNLNYTLPDNVYNSTRLPLPFSGYQQPQPVHNFHYPAGSNQNTSFEGNMLQITENKMAPNKQRITDKNPNLDVRQFLSTWDDEEDDKPTDNGLVEPQAVLDCKTVKSNASVSIDEKDVAECNPLIPNFIPYRNKDKLNGTADAKSEEGANNESIPSLQTSVIQGGNNNNTTTKSTPKLMACNQNIDAVLESSQCNPDRYSLWYDNLKKNNDRMVVKCDNPVAVKRSESSKCRPSFIIEEDPQIRKHNFEKEYMNSEWSTNTHNNLKYNNRVLEDNPCPIVEQTFENKTRDYAENFMVSNISQGIGDSKEHQNNNPFNFSHKANSNFANIVNYPKESLTHIACTTSQIQDYSFKPKNIYEPHDLYNTTVSATHVYPSRNYMDYSDSYYSNLNDYNYRADCSGQSVCKEKQVNYVENIDKNIESNPDISLVKADLEKSLNEITHQLTTCTDDQTQVVGGNLTVAKVSETCDSVTHNSEMALDPSDNICKMVETDSTELDISTCIKHMKNIEPAIYNGVIHKTGTCDDWKFCDEERSLSMPSLSPPTASESEDNTVENVQKPIDSSNITLNDVYDDNAIIFDTEGSNIEKSDSNDNFNLKSSVDVNIEIHQPLNLALSKISPRSNGTHTSVVKIHKTPESDTQELIAEELDHKNLAYINTSKIDGGYYVNNHLDSESVMQKKPLVPSKEQLLHHPNHQNTNVDINNEIQEVPYQTCIVSCKKYECHTDKFDQNSNIEGEPLHAPIDNKTICESVVNQEETDFANKDDNPSDMPTNIYNGISPKQNTSSDTNLSNTDYSYLCNNYKSVHETSYKHNEENIDSHEDSNQVTTNLYNYTQEEHVGTEEFEKNGSPNNLESQNKNDILIGSGLNITNINELLNGEYIPSDISITCTTFPNNDDHNANVSQEFFKCNDFNESIGVTNSITNCSTVNISAKYEQDSNPSAIILHKDDSLDKMENGCSEKQYSHYRKNCKSTDSMNCDRQNKSESPNVETCKRDFDYGIDLSTNTSINEENTKDQNSNCCADFQNRIINYDKEVKNDVNENESTTDYSLNLHLLATSSNEINLSKISKFSVKNKANSTNIKYHHSNSLNEGKFKTFDNAMNNSQNQKPDGSGINDETISRSTYLNSDDGAITITPSCNDMLLELHKESNIHNNGNTSPVSQGTKFEHMNIKEKKYKKFYGDLYKTSVNNNSDTISYINNSDYFNKNANLIYKMQATMNNVATEPELGYKSFNYNTGKRHSTNCDDDNNIVAKKMKTNVDSTFISSSTELSNYNYKEKCNQKANSGAEILGFQEKNNMSQIEMYGKSSCKPTSKKQKKKQKKERFNSKMNRRKYKNLIQPLRNSDCEVSNTEIYKLNKKRDTLNNNEIWFPDSHLSDIQLPKNESDVPTNNYRKESELLELRETHDSYIDSPSISDLADCDWYRNSSNKFSSSHQITSNNLSFSAKSFQQIHHIEFDEENKNDDGDNNKFMEDIYITPNIAPTPHCDLNREEIMDYELLPECPQFLPCNDDLPDPSFNAPTPHCDFPNEDNMPHENLDDDSENCKAPSPNFVFYDDGDDLRAFTTVPSPCVLNDFITNNVETVKQDIDYSLNNIPSSTISSIAPSPQCDINTGGDEDDPSVFSHLQNKVSTLKNLAFNALGHIGVYIDTLLSNDLNIFEIRLSPEQTEIIVHTDDQFSTDTLFCDREIDVKCDEEEEDQPCQCLIINNKESVVCLRCPLNSSLIINDARTTESRPNNDDDTDKESNDTDNETMCECIEELFIDQKITLSPSHVLEDYEFLSVYSQLSQKNCFNLRREYVEEQIKVELPWQKIFDLEKHPEQCSVLKQLELGPAQIEVRIPCLEMQTKNVMNCKQEHSSPVLKVKRLIIQPAINVDDTQNSYSFVLTAGDKRIVVNKGEECEKCENDERRTTKVSMTAVEENQKCDSNEILAVPKMVIKKTKYREYKSYFQSNCYKVLQPQVRLNRSRSLDELALKFTQEKERYSFDLNDFKKHLTPDWGIRFDYNENQFSNSECEADISSLEERPVVDEIEKGIQEICETLKDTSVGETIEIRKPERHHCLLCHRSYSSAEKYVLHVKSKFHRHLELTQRKTIHAIYRRFTGSICPRLRPLTAYERKKMKWKPRDPNIRHVYHEKTPLQIALHVSTTQNCFWL